MPLFWLSLAFLSGILIAASIAVPMPVWIILSFFSILLLVPPVYRLWSRILPASTTSLTQQLKINSLRLLPLLLLFIALGATRYLVSIPSFSPSFVAYYNDQPAEFILEGVLAEPPDMRDTYINLRITVERIRTLKDHQFTPVSGLLLARVSTDSSFTYGDLIRIEGRLATPPENEDFSYRDYLANQGIYSYMSYPSVSLLQHGQGNPVMSAIYSIRQHALELVYRIFPDPEASLVAGILLGEQAGISPQIQEAFRLTGTSHIIVISGFNISIIAALFTRLFTRFLGRRWGAIISALGIISYTLMVGANPAVVRAAILGMLTLLAIQVGRRQVGLNSLLFVAALMALRTPTVVWDVSFQLSFAATLGIMLYAEPLTNFFTNLATRIIPRQKAEYLAGPVGEYFLITLAAQLTTMPLMIYYFKRLSLSSLIANPLILPVQPAIMVLGGLSLLIGILFQPIGQLLAWTAWPFVAYTIRVVEGLSDIPQGSIPLGQVSLPIIFLFFAVLFAITFARSRLSALVSRLTPAIPLAILVAITVLTWKVAYYAPDGLLHVTILNVGTSDGVLIQSPHGRYVLINGGSRSISLSNALGRRLPPFNRSLDWLVVADIDDEDLSALAVNLERIHPANVLWAGNSYGTYSASRLWAQILAHSIPTTHMQPGQSLNLGSGAHLKVISTSSRGAVLLLNWDNFRLLLPMSLDFTELDTLQKNKTMRNITALFLAESGYAPLNPPEFISFLHPQLALLSVAPADRTGLPSPETVQALQGYTLLRTDQNGWIELTTDGTQLWVEVESK
jgi:competence protein ComEC